MKLSNEMYDFLKWVAMYLLPALGTLFLTLASIWNIPYAQQIGATIAGIDVFLAAILGISTDAYNKENVHISVPRQDLDNYGRIVINTSDVDDHTVTYE